MNTNRFPNASYKGIGFYWAEHSYTHGTKNVLHEYPNRDRGYIENLGNTIKQWSLKCDISNAVNSNNINEFEEILETGKKQAGNLILPYRGIISNVQVLSYSTTESKNSIGLIRYAVEFAQTSESIYPTSTNASVGFLDRLKDELLNDNIKAFVNKWNAVKNKALQTQEAFNKVAKTGRELNSLANKVEGAGFLLSGFTNSIISLTQDTRKLIQSPSVLATNLKMGFEALEGSIEDVDILYDVVAQYFDFSGGNVNYNATGNIIKESEENQEAVNNLIKTNAIAIAYTIAPLLTYKIRSDVVDTRDAINNAYDTLPEDIDNDIYVKLQTIQINSNKILDNISVSLPTIQSITVERQPLVILVYSLYGSLALYDEIYELNNFIDSSCVEGEVLIFANIQ